MTKTTACRLLGIRVDRWPDSWPLPSGHQVILLRALQRAGRDSFVAAVDPTTSIYRIVVLTKDRRPVSREYALLPDGRLRHVRAGEPFEDEPVAA